MEFTVRPARSDDAPAIATFTTGTFAWGDYVADAFPRWLEDPGLCVLVAADGGDRACAVAHAGLLGPAEAWLGGMRVAPEHRRQGLAGRITDELLDWSRRNGALVARLAIEEWNEAAIRQARGKGFRPAGRWVGASRPVGDASPNLAGNGGARATSADRLRRVPATEADPGYLSWSSGELARASRELFPIGWEWRRLRLDDLRAAADRSALWAGPPGWAIADGGEQGLSVTWLETAPGAAHPLLRALVDAAVESGVERIEVKVPRADWLVQSARRAGFAVDFELAIFARTL